MKTSFSLLLLALSASAAAAGSVEEDRELFFWRRWKRRKEEKLTITQKLFAMATNYTPDVDAIIEEKMPTIEKILESNVATSPIFFTNHCVQRMRDNYVALEASIESDEMGMQRNSEPVVTSENFDLQAFIDERMPVVEAALLESITGPAPETQLLVESATYSLMAGGKRIRPLLCMATFEMFSPDGDVETALPAAVSAEMIHAMSLIGDDLPSFDNDSMRRGIPSNHEVYGENVAMLAAGSLISYAFQQVMETKGAEPKVVLDVATRLAISLGVMGLAGGEMMDMVCQEKENVTLLDLQWIHFHKTAALIKYAVASGALLGGASAEEVAAVEDYAENIGLAFQVVDDILDVTQTSEQLGKTAGKDEASGKLTYPKLLGLDGARAEAQLLVSKAKQALAPFGDRAAALLAIADFILERTY